MDMTEAKRPVRSMTGYASLQFSVAAGELTVVLRAVNGRNLDFHFHLGTDLARHENAIRVLLKEGCARGNVEVRLSLAANVDNSGYSFHYEQLAKYVAAFRDANSRLQLQSDPDLNRLLSLPGVLSTSAGTRAEVTEGEVILAVRQALEELNRFRSREGTALAEAVIVLLDTIEDDARQLSAIRAEALPELLARLKERLRSLLEGSNLPPQRLAEEAALAADGSDIAEELVRLQVHADELRRLLTTGGVVGKRLDFLLQEMNRETNTMLSKTSGIGRVGLTATNLALAIKANIERIREQSLNLE